MTGKGKSEFATWLEKRFLEWQNTRGERSTLDEFAEWLEPVGRPSGKKLFTKQLVSHYFYDRASPSGERLDAIADRLGDMAYILLNRLPPDPILREILIAYVNLPRDGNREDALIRFAKLALENIGYRRPPE